MGGPQEQKWPQICSNLKYKKVFVMTGLNFPPARTQSTRSTQRTQYRHFFSGTALPSTYIFLGESQLLQSGNALTLGPFRHQSIHPSADSDSRFRQPLSHSSHPSPVFPEIDRVLVPPPPPPPPTHPRANKAERDHQYRTSTKRGRGLARKQT